MKTDDDLFAEYDLDMQPTKSHNDYFFQTDDVYLSAVVTTNNIPAYENGNSSKPIKTESRNISVSKISIMTNGSVYKLVVESVDDIDGYLSEARLNIYFYVTSEKTYRIWSFIDGNGTIKEFCDDDVC